MEKKSLQIITVTSGTTRTIYNEQISTHYLKAATQSFAGGACQIIADASYTPVYGDTVTFFYKGGTLTNYSAGNVITIFGTTIPLRFASGKTLRIECFYDDTSTWRITFHPNATDTGIIDNDDIPDSEIDLRKLSNAAGTAHIIVSGAANVWSDVTMSGDATIATTGALTIGNLAVTTAKIDNLAVTAGKLAATTVAAGAYGSATQSPTFTVDAQGRLTAAANVTITGVSPVSSALTSANFWVGTAGNVAAAVTMSGSITMTNAGVTTIGAGEVKAGMYGAVSIAAADIASNAVTTTKIIDSAVTEAKVGSATAGNIITGVVCAKYINNTLITTLLDTATNNLCALKAGDTILKVIVAVQGVTAANLIRIGVDGTLRGAGADIDYLVVDANSAVLGNYNTELQAATYTGVGLTAGAFICDADGYVTIDTTANVAGTGTIGITIYYLPA